MLSNTGYVSTDDGVRLYFQKLGSGPAAIIPNAIHMFDSFQHLSDKRTLIFFDLRNRGSSDSVTGGEKLKRGIHQDVDDIDAIRRHFAIDQADLIGHSYVGLMVILYALKYPAHVRRIVQIGPSQPNASKIYPAHLTGADEVLAGFIRKLGEMQSEGQPHNPQPPNPTESCEKFWALMRTVMVADPADAGKIRWTPCNSPNEVGFMKHWTDNIQPSIIALDLAQQLSKVTAPVLTIHGTKDRQAPYGGGREWAMLLPNARLTTIENTAHVPWIEAPKQVLGSIERFLDGEWPESAEEVTSLER